MILTTFSDITIIFPFSFSLWYLLLLLLPKEPHFFLSLIRSLIPCNSPLCSPLLLFLLHLPPCLLPKDAFHFPWSDHLHPAIPLSIASQSLYPWKFLFSFFCGLYTYIWRLELGDSNEREHVIFCLSGSGTAALHCLWDHIAGKS